MTVRELIRDAMQEIGALAAGEPLGDSDAQVSLVRLNSMLALWQTERLMIGHLARLTWNFVSGLADYTIGPSGTPSPNIACVVRPKFISAITAEHGTGTSAYETPIVKVLQSDWIAIRLKALTSTYPTRFYYNPTHPLGTLSFYPVPTDATVKGVAYVPQPIGAVASLNTTLVLAAGEEEAVRYNLAIRLCLPFSRPLDQALASMANITKSQVQRANAVPDVLRVDPAIPGSASGAFNFFTGELV